MQIETQKDAALEKVGSMIDAARFAMLTTVDVDGSLHSRPMATMQMDSEGCLWFFTSASSLKVAEAQREQHVNLCYTRADKQDYLSISGTAEVMRDEAKMETLWTPWVKPWFPKGLSDPDLTLLKVKIDRADYWDAPNNVFERMYGLAKAIATGNKDALGDSGTIQA